MSISKKTFNEKAVQSFDTSFPNSLLKMLARHEEVWAHDVRGTKVVFLRGELLHFQTLVR